MDYGRFAGAQYPRLILPLILISVFMLLVAQYYFYVAPLMERHLCNATAALYFQEKNGRGKIVSDDNDTFTFTYNNETVTRQTLDNWERSLGVLNQKKGEISAIYKFSQFFMVVDPMLPVPCEIDPLNSFCANYVSQDTLECVGKYDFLIPKSYRQPDSLIIINLVYLFALGYLISWLFALRSGKMQKEKGKI